ncbi:centrosome-associated zinc finger protein CP190 isoform X2 [Harmonia axyridis]|nr:centrosome-associated zinc finger protein CP190 isoform X2 [Harmonia axyridis]
MEENKQVRVDNWGVFFLQRLQLFFNKTDYCDLTLQFQGNVQLKVHRLVLNACTEYFELLEQSDRLIDDNIILMPETLQPDVVVPIINFMYTGMLEYPLSIYNRLCQAADLMHISVLTKLLDAQKQTALLNKPEKITKAVQVKEIKPVPKSHSQMKKVISKPVTTDPPPIFPPRKLTGWKRKSLTACSSNSSFSSRSDSFNRSTDPLALDEAKPTRFEWPEDDLDLPNLDTMDISGFGDISYNSKPLLREDEVKTVLSKSDALKKQTSNDGINEIKIEDKLNNETNSNGSEKRKAESLLDKSPKRIKIVENERDTTISVIANEGSSNFDPTKIVSEILKKYPHLVKKKKNIKLKIVSKSHTEKETPKDCSPSEQNVEKPPVKTVLRKTSVFKPEVIKSDSKERIWACKECITAHGEPLEFMLYYLYRKHMTDVHNVKFDTRICKYCGIAFSKNEQHSYHQFTKHGIKPSGNQVFPSCSQCPFVAMSKEALQVHKNKHKKTEMQCSCCKLAFISPEAIAGHLQITGHMGKTRKNVYDCQYCTKSSQSAISLLSHLKSNHEAEAKRDGIVSLDEVDLEEGDDLMDTPVEEPSLHEEYVVSETQQNKVKIISNVTVPVSKNNTTETLALNQSKNHVSVPTSIATSLGLLDIVVLDENQQFILHNQAQQTGNNQTEYILPPIDTRNVTAEGLPSNDELVMVLTDQDYKEGHSGISTDNSNIVVLYSHPADGQQGQFITSQGNIMVNSETGLLEIRNGAAIATTSANQIVMSEPTENPIETIEMIQREIDGGQELKQEPFYEDQKPKITEVVQEPEGYVENPKVEEQNQQSSALEENIVNPDDGQPEEKKESQSEEPVVEQQASTPNLSISNETVEEQTSSMSAIDEVEPEKSTEEIVDSTERSTDNSEQREVESQTPVPMEVEDTSLVEECTSKPSEEMYTSENKDIEKDHSDTEETQDKQPSDSEKDLMMEIDESIDKDDEDITEGSLEKENNDNAEVEFDSSKESQPVKEKPLSPSSEKNEQKPYSPTDNPVDMECEKEPEPNEKQEAESSNENSIEITHCEKEPENQESTVSPHSSQIVDEEDTQDKHSEGTKESTTMSILDDWEDTDSQQSDNKTKAVKKEVAQETVHKLMDDWDEEEVEK